MSHEVPKIKDTLDLALHNVDALAPWEIGPGLELLTLQERMDVQVAHVTGALQDIPTPKSNPDPTRFVRENSIFFQRLSTIRESVDAILSTGYYALRSIPGQEETQRSPSTTEGKYGEIANRREVIQKYFERLMSSELSSEDRIVIENELRTTVGGLIEYVDSTISDLEKAEGISIMSFVGPGEAPHGLAGLYIVKYVDSKTNSLVRDIILRGSDVTDFRGVLRSLGLNETKDLDSRPGSDRRAYHSNARTSRTIGMRLISNTNDSVSIKPLIFRYFYGDSRPGGQFATQARVDQKVLKETPAMNLYLLSYLVDSSLEEAQVLNPKDKTMFELLRYHLRMAINEAKE